MFGMWDEVGLELASKQVSLPAFAFSFSFTASLSFGFTFGFLLNAAYMPRRSQVAGGALQSAKNR